jgi:hypothetical protein
MDPGHHRRCLARLVPRGDHDDNRQRVGRRGRGRRAGAPCCGHAAHGDRHGPGDGTNSEHRSMAGVPRRLKPSVDLASGQRRRLGNRHADDLCRHRPRPEDRLRARGGGHGGSCHRHHRRCCGRDPRHSAGRAGEEERERHRALVSRRRRARWGQATAGPNAAAAGRSSDAQGTTRQPHETSNCCLPIALADQFWQYATIGIDSPHRARFSRAPCGSTASLTAMSDSLSRWLSRSPCRSVQPCLNPTDELVVGSAEPAIAFRTGTRSTAAASSLRRNACSGHNHPSLRRSPPRASRRKACLEISLCR